MENNNSRLFIERRQANYFPRFASCNWLLRMARQCVKSRVIAEEDDRQKSALFAVKGRVIYTRAALPLELQLRDPRGTRNKEAFVSASLE